MNSIDKRNKFEEEVFSFKTSKDNKVFILWNGKQVSILRGKASEKFLSKISDADFLDAQLIMAKATGNFKRGNEKNCKENYKNAF